MGIPKPEYKEKGYTPGVGTGVRTGTGVRPERNALNAGEFDGGKLVV